MSNRLEDLDIEEDTYHLLIKKLKLIHLKLNAYIKFIGKKNNFDDQWQPLNSSAKK